MFSLYRYSRCSKDSVLTFIWPRLQVYNTSLNPHSSAGLKLSPFPHFKEKKIRLQDVESPPQDYRPTPDSWCGQRAFSIYNLYVIPRTQPRVWLLGDIQEFMNCVAGSQICVMICYCLFFLVEFSLAVWCGCLCNPHTMEGAIWRMAAGFRRAEKDSLPPKVSQSSGGRKDKLRKRYKIWWNTRRAYRRA